MTATTTTGAATDNAELTPARSAQRPTTGLALWIRQALAVARIEIKRTLLSRRVIPLLVLAGLPIFIMVMATIATIRFGDGPMESVGEARIIYSGIFQGLILGGVVFLGSAAVFTSLFRGEVLGRSLHYYFLSPVRREVLAGGKYLSGLAATIAVACGTTLLSFLLLYVPHGLERAFEDLTGAGGEQLFWYLAICVLGVIGYGAVFLLLGLVFRNPILPIVGLLGWELLHPLLPAALKKLSVTHYLKGLLPVPPEFGPFAVVVEPPAAWVSLFGLMGLTVVALLVAGFYLRRLEIRYADS